MAAPLARLVHGSFIRFGKLEALLSVREEGEENPLPSFELRDHLIELYPDRAAAIQKAFRDSRESGVDLAEELVLRATLSPGEWWAGAWEFRHKRSAGRKGGFLSRIFGKGGERGTSRGSAGREDS